MSNIYDADFLLKRSIAVFDWVVNTPLCEKIPNLLNWFPLLLSRNMACLFKLHVFRFYFSQSLIFNNWFYSSPTIKLQPNSCKVNKSDDLQQLKCKPCYNYFNHQNHYAKSNRKYTYIRNKTGDITKINKKWQFLDLITKSLIPLPNSYDYNNAQPEAFDFTISTVFSGIYITHFMPLVFFYTIWKHQKTRGRLMFLRLQKETRGKWLIFQHFRTFSWKTESRDILLSSSFLSQS